MKLLDKLQVNLFKASERKLEIDQGKKLAESVDKLREMKAKEEQSLALFRDKAVSEAKAQIKGLIEERDAVGKEIGELEKRRVLAMKPLNEYEERLEKREQEVVRKEENILQKELDLGHDVVQSMAIRQEAATYSATIETRTKEAERLQAEADRNLKESKNQLRRTELIYKAASDKADQAKAYISSQEASIAERTRSLDLMYANMQAREKELSLRERGIIDREEQLMRELERRVK